MEIDSDLRWTLGIVVVVYLIVMYAVSIFASSKIHNVEDYAVAGRRLPLSLAWMTLLATWFGAGTILAVPDEIRKEGLSAAALDPLGAGFCLLLTGLLIAGPMWREKLLTVPDLFRKRFGRAAELMAAFVMVPSYFGWIAAQFVALAGMANLFFGIDPFVGLALVGAIGTGYTLIGGMWSVTLTDGIQVILLLLGLIVLGVTVAMELGGMSTAVARLTTEISADHLTLVPSETATEFLRWLGLFAAGALGNMPGQDLMQRVFASKSERVARTSCYIAGGAYMFFGAIPVFIGLAANLLVPESVEGDLLPAIAGLFLHPAVAVVFVVALLSAVLSTIDSAILSPATVMAQNILPSHKHIDSLLLNRLCVVIVAGCSLALAYKGESAWSMLEGAYSLTLVGLFVPMILGLFTKPVSGWPALASMMAGAGIWLIHFTLNWEYFLEPVPWIGHASLPDALCCTVLSLLAYIAVDRVIRARPGSQKIPAP